MLNLERQERDGLPRVHLHITPSNYITLLSETYNIAISVGSSIAKFVFLACISHTFAFFNLFIVTHYST
jgi:hypothetical protein